MTTFAILVQASCRETALQKLRERQPLPFGIARPIGQMATPLHHLQRCLGEHAFEGVCMGQVYLQIFRAVPDVDGRL